MLRSGVGICVNFCRILFNRNFKPFNPFGFDQLETRHQFDSNRLQPRQFHPKSTGYNFYGSQSLKKISQVGSRKNQSIRPKVVKTLNLCLTMNKPLSQHSTTSNERMTLTHSTWIKRIQNWSNSVTFQQGATQYIKRIWSVNTCFTSPNT